MRTIRLVGLVAFFFFGLLPAHATTIDFEQFNDGDVLTNQIPGLTFSNTMILTAGISLNEIDFPPHSGQNVASDSGGPIQISFAAPIVSFSGYFTYTTSVTLEGFDSSNNLLSSVASLYSANYVGSGVAGSSPNELMQIRSADGISRILLEGDPAGGSFVMDDISFSSAPSAVPEPENVTLIVLGMTCLFCRRKRLAQRDA